MATAAGVTRKGTRRGGKRNEKEDEKEEPGARKTNEEGGHLRKIEERHHLIPPSYLCISKREFVCVYAYTVTHGSLYVLYKRCIFI